MQILRTTSITPIASSIGILALLALLAPPAVAQVSVPHTASGVVLDVGSESFEVDIDLLTLPDRPRVRAVATPDAGHADMVLDLEVVDCDAYEFFFNDDFPPPAFPPICPFDWSSDLTPGAAEALAELWECNPIPAAGDDRCTVRVTATSFGTAGAPATVDLVITGETKRVTGTLEAVVDLAPVAQQVVLGASRDATIYEQTNDSNGGGRFLLAGDYSPSFLAAPLERRALLHFDVESVVPYGASVQSAELRLFVETLSDEAVTTRLHLVDPDTSWGEGNNDPGGTEEIGLSPDQGDVTWFNAKFFSSFPVPWALAGGDFVTPESVLSDVTLSNSVHVWTSPQLAADVEAMIDVLPNQSSQNQGWILRGPLANNALEEITPFSFASRESPVVQNRPSLTVDYTPGLVSTGDVEFDRVQFIQDGDNFRWTYDDDCGPDLLTCDDVVETFEPSTQLQLGSCEVVNTFDPFTLPYAYTFVGDPTFVGHDCCTWQMESPDTGALGSGQALFYVNLGLGSPPKDIDADGIFDPCDNCVYIPNGPLLGTCVQVDTEVTDNDTCLSDLDCDAGEFCSQAQEDLDFDSAKAQACPEPGETLILACGSVVLYSVGRRRARS